MHSYSTTGLGIRGELSSGMVIGQTKAPCGPSTLLSSRVWAFLRGALRIKVHPLDIHVHAQEELKIKHTAEILVGCMQSYITTITINNQTTIHTRAKTQSFLIPHR